MDKDRNYYWAKNTLGYDLKCKTVRGLQQRIEAITPEGEKLNNVILSLDQLLWADVFCDENGIYFSSDYADVILDIGERRLALRLTNEGFVKCSTDKVVLEKGYVTPSYLHQTFCDAPYQCIRDLIGKTVSEIKVICFELDDDPLLPEKSAERGAGVLAAPCGIEICFVDQTFFRLFHNAAGFILEFAESGYETYLLDEMQNGLRVSLREGTPAHHQFLTERIANALAERDFDDIDLAYTFAKDFSMQTDWMEAELTQEGKVYQQLNRKLNEMRSCGCDLLTKVIGQGQISILQTFDGRTVPTLLEVGVDKFGQINSLHFRDDGAAFVAVSLGTFDLRYWDIPADDEAEAEPECIEMTEDMLLEFLRQYDAQTCPSDVDDSQEEENAPLSDNTIHQLPRYEMSFSDALLKLICQSNRSAADIYRNGMIDRRLFSKICKNKEYHPQKDTAIQFCIALQLPVAEANRLLETAGYVLTPNIIMDRIIINCLENGIYDLIEINERLYDNGQRTLGC